MSQANDPRAQVREEVRKTLEGNKVVLFMKGNKSMPQCGFSAALVGVLNEIGCPFKDVNVLADPVLRDEVKAMSNWPTYPQLYVAGELVGGCDIVREMHARGELAPKINAALGKV